MGERGQLRTIIASTNQSNASHAVGESLHSFRQNWCEAGSQKEIEVASATPDHPWQASSSMGDDFSPVILKNPLSKAVK